MRPIVSKVTAQAASATSIAALTTLGAAGVIPQNGALATAVGVAAAQTTAGAGFLLLNGTKAFSNTVKFVTPTRLNLTSTGNLSTTNFTITGMVAQGPDTTGNTSGPQIEVLAGPNNNVVTSLNTWTSISSIAVSAAVGTNVSAYGTALLANATQVELVSVNDLHLINFTIYGFNASGQPTVEVMAGPTSSTVLSVNYWSAVTQITTSGIVTAVSVGNGASASTPAIVVDYLQEPFNLGVQCSLVAGDATNYTVQVTADDIFGGTPYVTPSPTWLSASVVALVAASTSQIASLTVPCRAIRTITNSGSGVVTTTVIQGINP